jgi:selenide,water dikinase
VRPLQDMFRPEEYPDLLVGLGAPDDAAVWRLGPDQALVVTTDFFTPVVDDAYDYGAIAATNALSDLYAMGARPILALNVAAVPPSLDIGLIQDIFRGSAEKVRQAGAVVAGGHTLQDNEPKVGLVAVGLAHPSQLMTKGGARPGDVLVLTKPLGSGVTTTALKRGVADSDDVAQAVDWMTQLNAPASVLALGHGVRGATDITGYGLLGHGLELADASGVRLVIEARAVPFLRGAFRYVRSGCLPGGSADNALYFGPRVRFDASLDEYARFLLFDAQTSGGLLLSLPSSRTEAFMAEASSQGVPAWIIGRVEPGEGMDVSGSEPSHRTQDAMDCVCLPGGAGA